MLLLMGQAPAVHVPSAGVRGWRQLIEYRHRLVAKRVRAKNGLRAIGVFRGEQVPGRSAGPTVARDARDAAGRRGVAGERGVTVGASNVGPEPGLPRKG